MLSKQHILNEKYRAERSAEIAAACDITANSMSVVYYDLALRRRYARSALVGTAVSADAAHGLLAKLLVTSMRGFDIPASAVKRVGIAAPVHIESAAEFELTPSGFFLPPEAEIFFVPFISAGISGRFTASLLTLPDEDCAAADLGKTLCAAYKKGNGYCCAAFPMEGAFDGSGLESGMPAEKGAIDAVRRESDGTIVYEVVQDAESIGISPCGAIMAVNVMRGTGSLDADGIMTDRDLFCIGEDLFISQSDIRAIQSDKARAAAALELLAQTKRAFFSGEPFSTAEGFEAMLKLGAIPKRFAGGNSAGFCRNSVEQGIILCLKSVGERRRAIKISQKAEDITERLLPEFDELYLSFLPF